MQVTTVTQAKARLSAVLRRVSHGETIPIRRHDKPIARLVPAVAGGNAPSKAEFTRMEQGRIVRLPSLPPDPDLLVADATAPVAAQSGLLAALLPEREADR